MELKEGAAEAINGFDIQRWLQWGYTLNGRVQGIGNPTEVFQVLALERFEAARELHARALRNRSKTALHELRIGIKKFRYIIENFLPAQDKSWGADLKHIQDVLGEVDDLDVMWETARQIRAFVSLQERQSWYAAISRERTQRVQAYREKMVGRNSLWHEWRSGLPTGEYLQKAVLKRFETWAGSLDPDPTHTHTVTQFSLEIFDALQKAGLVLARGAGAVSPRDLLQVAALTIGASRRFAVVGLSGPLSSWGTPLHPKVLPGPVTRGAASRRLPGRNLRLADSLGGQHDRPIRGIAVSQNDGRTDIIADGYDPRSKQAEKIAAARHLLEHAFNTALLVRESSRGHPASPTNKD